MVWGGQGWTVIRCQLPHPWLPSSPVISYHNSRHIRTRYLLSWSCQKSFRYCSPLKPPKITKDVYSWVDGCCYLFCFTLNVILYIKYYLVHYCTVVGSANRNSWVLISTTQFSPYSGGLNNLINSKKKNLAKPCTSLKHFVKRKGQPLTEVKRHNFI